MSLQNKIISALAKRPFVQPGLAAQPDESLGALKGYFRSFGNLNPEKAFYVIWRKNHGSGFFSNFAFVLAHTKVAVENGMVPMVDFEHFPTLYDDARSIGGESSSWTRYFSQPSNHCLREVYSSSNVFFCDGTWPAGLPLNISKIPGLFSDVYEKRFCFSRALTSYLEKCGPMISTRTMGLHFRGKEQNLAPGHWFGPTVQQVLDCVDSILSRHPVDKIFVVTEDPAYLQALLSMYGNRIIYLNSYRSAKVNAYNENPRERHRYLLGMEICVEGILLSRCMGLLCGASNVSDFAVFHNNGNYKFIYRIDNGRNSDRRLLALVMYRLKKHLPPFLGGLKNGLVITESGTIRRTRVNACRRMFHNTSNDS